MSGGGKSPSDGYTTYATSTLPEVELGTSIKRPACMAARIMCALGKPPSTAHSGRSVLATKMLEQGFEVAYILNHFAIVLLVGE